MKKALIISTLSIWLFKLSISQTYHVQWQHDLYGDIMPDSSLVDTSDGVFTYLTNGDSIFLDTYAETRAIAIDKSNNSIDVSDNVGGYYETPAFNYNSMYPNKIQVNKRDPLGNIIWRKYFTNTVHHGLGWGIETDTSDNILVCGHYQDSIDLDPSPTSTHYIHSAAGMTDNGFVATLDPNGNFLSALNITSSGELRCYDLKLDKQNNLYVIGAYTGTADFDPGAGTALSTSTGINEDAFVVKLDANGNYLWHHVGECSNLASAWKCDVNDVGEIFVVGNFTGSLDFSGNGTDPRMDSGSFDAYLLKLDANGNYQWMKQYGASSSEQTRRVLCSDQGVYVVGLFFSDTLNVDPGVTDSEVVKSGPHSTFLQRLDNDGNHIWATTIGEGRTDIYGISEDHKGNIYVSGFINSQTVFTLPHGNDTLNNDSRDILIAIADTNGNFISAQSWNSPDWDWANDIEVINEREYVVAGTFSDLLYLNEQDSSQLLIGEGPGYEGFTFKAAKCIEVIDSSLITCNPITSPTGSYTWTSSGTYNDTAYVSGGCDIVYVFNLTVGESFIDTVQVQNCGTYTSPSGNHSWSSTGISADSMLTVTGCDSIIVIDLEILNPSYDSISVVSCDSYTSPGGQTFTFSGNYTDTLTNSVGCDSVITIDLVINESTDSSLTITSCDEYTVPSGNSTYYMSGIYYDTLSTQAGCDSILIIDLMIHETPDTTINSFGDSLVALETGMEYQWLDCNKSNGPILNANSSYYVASASGSYALEISNNGCSDTSSCHEIDVISSVAQNFGSSISVYPNPVINNQVLVSLESQNVEYKLYLYDALGKLCWSSHSVGNKVVNLPESSGIYILEIRSEEWGVQKVKLIQ